ncbi:hypothetical protein AOLI_G00127720 [Acnodon oligacanthus]
MVQNALWSLAGEHWVVIIAQEENLKGPFFPFNSKELYRTISKKQWISIKNHDINVFTGAVSSFVSCVESPSTTAHLSTSGSLMVSEKAGL